MGGLQLGAEHYYCYVASKGLMFSVHELVTG